MIAFEIRGTRYWLNDQSGQLMESDLALAREDGELVELKFTVRFAGEAAPQKLTLQFSLPCVGMFSSWTPTLGFKKGLLPDWAMLGTASRAASGMPVMTVLDAAGENAITLAVSDYQTPLTLRAGVVEESGEMQFRIEFFTHLMSRRDAYEAVIRIDRSKRPYYECLRDVRRWWDAALGPRIPIPETTRLPVYSTWYGFHQQLEVDAIVRECELARKWGMDSIIVDDGWQTADNQRGYAHCGDWEYAPEKVGNLREFVDRVHQAGLKFILWYSVPFVGVHSKAYERFVGKFLRARDSGVYVLDPRFPEVRDYLVGLYRDHVRQFDLDGLKLDFIDAFELTAESSQANPDRDYDSLEEAIERLLNEVCAALLALKPNMAIEFRQGYVGPLMRKYGNMLRVGDCPADALRNRVGVIDLRLTSGETPVHSDMLMWHPGTAVEEAARQITATLFGVPQFSVRLDQLPEKHRQMVRFYLKFWTTHRSILLDGELKPLAPEQNYPVVSATSGGQTIAVIYGNSIYEPADGVKTLHAINSSGTDEIFIQFGRSRKRAMCHVVDCMGITRERAVRRVLNGIKTFRVPICGVLTVKFQSNRAGQSQVTPEFSVGPRERGDRRRRG